MDFDHLPRTDLARLKTEILDGDASRALPCNLSESWLLLLARDLEEVVGDGPCDAASQFMPGPAAVVMHILASRVQEAPLAVSFEQFFQHLREYRLELALELVRRKTQTPLSPATLDTILTGRRRL
jgi:hypothetical protein